MDTHTYGHGARASTLWGKGPNGGSRGRTIVATTVGALALLVPVSTAAAAQTTYVAPGLLAKADKSPTKTVHVIVQSTGGETAAESATKGLGSLRIARVNRDHFGFRHEAVIGFDVDVRDESRAEECDFGFGHNKRKDITENSRDRKQGSHG